MDSDSFLQMIPDPKLAQTFQAPLKPHQVVSKITDIQNHRLQKAGVCAEHLGFSAHLTANPNEGKLIWYFWLLRRGLPIFIDLGEAKSDINGLWLGPCVLQAEDVHEHLKRSSGCICWIACIACIQNIQNMGLSFT